MARKITLLIIIISSVFGLQAQSKLTRSLADSIKNIPPNEYIAVSITVNSSFDINHLSQDLYNANATLNERAKTVITRLQEEASNTQASILLQLNEMKKEGKVNSFTSFWISNTISTEIMAGYISELSALSDVYEIGLKISIIQDDNSSTTTGIPRCVLNANTNTINSNITSVKAPMLWDLGITGCGRLVMNLDKGVDGDHPALNYKWRGNFVPPEEAWWDGSTTPSITPEQCLNYHGTQTMGIITGYDKSSNYSLGVAKESEWVAAAATCGDPEDDVDDVLEAFQWTLNPDGDITTIADMPDAVNCSFRLTDVTDECNNKPLKNIFDALEAAGIAVIWIAGNYGNSPSSISTPANINTNLVNMFSVGAIDHHMFGFSPPQQYSDPIWYDPIVGVGSSIGPSICTTGNSSLDIKPEVVAPGVHIKSSCHIPGSSNYEHKYVQYDNSATEELLSTGTSFAAPHVTGTVALLKQAFPNLTGEQIKLGIYYSALDLGVPKFDSNGQPIHTEDSVYGMGLLDAFAAFKYLAGIENPITNNIDQTAKYLNLNNLIVGEQKTYLGCSIVVEGGSDLSGSEKVEFFAGNEIIFQDEFSSEGEMEACISFECDNCVPRQARFSNRNKSTKNFPQNFSKNSKKQNKVLEKEQHHVISIYPNPNSGEFTLETPATKQTQLVIYDAMGKTLVNQSITSNKTQINLSRYGKGVYIVVVNNSEQTIRERVIVK